MFLTYKGLDMRQALDALNTMKCDCFDGRIRAGDFYKNPGLALLVKEGASISVVFGGGNS